MPDWVEGANRPASPELRVVPPTGERREGGDRRRLSRVRLAAVGDFHVGEEDAGAYRDLFSRANDEADVLLLCGDLTRRGLAPEFKAVVSELADVKIPIVAVLGNHDYESGQMNEGTTILRGRGVHVLAGDAFELNEHLGFAGVKGFMGGFGRGTLTAFGEPETKAFVAAALEEVQRFELALRRLATPIRVAMLHYSPVVGTVTGEPEIIYPFLGTDRLAEPIDRYGCALAFHGHAHSGTFRAQTSGGVPVFNVSLPLLRKEGLGKMYYVHEVATPMPSVSAG
ncbi:MAG TPA: metallophosphoesterase [Gemmatimonadaceae bacterium]|jgi:Icc-related predicted phosphoesterase|nr:metallophosphoesterase [Gemmatimonadaceae bacterium]